MYQLKQVYLHDSDLNCKCNLKQDGVLSRHIDLAVGYIHGALRKT